MRTAGSRRPAPGAIASRALGVVAATLLLTACPGDPTPPTTTTTSTSTTTTTPTGGGTSFATSFADGTIPAPWESAAATVVTGTGDPASWVHLVAAGNAAFVSLPPTALEPGHGAYTFHGRFRVTARAAGQTVGLVTVVNSNRVDNADLFVDARTGRCRIDVNRADTALSPGRCDDGQWHVVTITGDFAAPTATMGWTLDGAPMASVRSATATATTVRRLYAGDATTGKTDTTDWTDLGFTLT